MKLLKNLTSVALIALVAMGCQEEDQVFGAIKTPTNLEVSATITGADAENPYGDGSGEVTFTASATDALSYKFVLGTFEKVAPSGSYTHIFSTLGVNTYDVVVLAYGAGGTTTSSVITIDVRADYTPPADFLQKLLGDTGTRTWRIKAEGPGHFGLGPVNDWPFAYYSAAPGDKAATGMYDDRYIFSEDGTFTHITNSVNDDNGTDTSGTVFGRDPYIMNDLGPTSEVPNGADIENYPLDDYSELWSVIAPGGTKTFVFSGLAFIGYYTGGNHQYVIMEDPDNPMPSNEFRIKTTDANSEFDWGFIIIADE